MPIEWVIPAVDAAFNHEDDIVEAWRSIKEKVVGRKVGIAVTGHSGAGKSVLMDFLTGKGFEQGYNPPPESTLLEKAKRKSGKVGRRIRMGLSVVPGSDSPIRYQSLDEIFDPYEGPGGVIHVLSNGYVSLRSDMAQDVLQGKFPTIDDYIVAQLASELEDMKTILDKIRTCVRRGDNPKWLVLAVTKSDLFADRMPEVSKYYIGDDSAFSKTLRAYTSQIGTDRLAVKILPISCVLEPFTYGTSVIEPMILARQRDLMVANLAKVLEELCRGYADA